jgi:DivIVA domain-containing protein
MGRQDVDGVRFAVGMRGYRMDEVDDVLDRLAAEVDQRDAKIAELESRLAGRGIPRPDATDPGA